MDKFQDKYRIPSNRKSNWDYSGNGIYFLTIVTQGRDCNLGRIVEAHGRASLSMELSEIGKIVETEWHKSFELRTELFLDEFTIMPNHIHAIVALKKKNRNYQPLNDSDGLTTMHHCLNAPIKRTPPVRLPVSISSFIAGFKSAVNSKIDDYIDANNLNIPKYNRNNHFFQPNYHDHVIKTDVEYQSIKAYIANNVSNWNEDTLFNQ
jgi:putative transposase